MAKVVVDDLRKQIEDTMLNQVDSIMSVITVSETTEQSTLWQKLKLKLSEQGSQRGILAIIPLIAAQFNLPTEDLINLFTFVLGVIGVHNFVTPD